MYGGDTNDGSDGAAVRSNTISTPFLSVILVWGTGRGSRGWREKDLHKTQSEEAADYHAVPTSQLKVPEHW